MFVSRSTFGFSLTLPRALNEIKTVKHEKVNISVLAGSTILLVEDNSTNQEIILGLLEDSGIIIDIANNGAEAVEMFKTNEYELILMDIQMPVMDGYEATHIIRDLIACSTPKRVDTEVFLAQVEILGA